MVMQMRLQWTGYGSDPHYSILNYPDDTDPILAMDAFLDFMLAIDDLIIADYSWQFEDEVRILDTVTGQLQSIEPTTAPPADQGLATLEPVADATQLLVRWRTDTIAGGRRLQGRTYLPGFSIGSLSDGNVIPSTVSTVTTAANALVGSGYAPVVWSRKNGIIASVGSASVWTEWATQRKRRG